jgi:hypothetical protein
VVLEFIRNFQQEATRVKLPRLRLRVCSAIFGHFFQGKVGLRSQSRRDSLRHRWVAYQKLALKKIMQGWLQ